MDRLLALVLLVVPLMVIMIHTYKETRSKTATVIFALIAVAISKIIFTVWPL